MDHKALTALGAQLVAGRYILDGQVVASHTSGVITLTEAGLDLQKPAPAPKAPKAKKVVEPEAPKVDDTPDLGDLSDLIVGETTVGKYTPAK